MATIIKRETSDGRVVFRVQVRMRGAKSMSATFERITDARKWAAATESAIREGRHFSKAESKRHTVAELLERYEREVLPRKGDWGKGQQIQLVWWSARIGHVLLSDVTGALITEARDALAAVPVLQGKTERPRSAAAVNRYLALLSHAFTIACNDWGWIEYNPVRKVSRLREPRGRVRFLDERERTKLLSECKASRNPALHDVVLLAICTGMRRSEIMNLTWDAVDLHRRMITLEHTKNGERRAVPLVGPALDAMRERAQVRRIDTNLVFPGRRRYAGTLPMDIQNAWKAALERAGIRDFRFHDLRHTAASYLAMSGATLPEIAAILGHKTLNMVQRYAHLSDSHVSAVVERMSAAVFDSKTHSSAEGNVGHE